MKHDLFSVLSQSSPFSKSFTTILKTNQFLTSMNFHVLEQIASETETCFTNCACEKIFYRMKSWVFGQSRASCESSTTDRATKGFLPCVASHVHHNISPSLKSFFTNWAAETFFCWMTFHMSCERFLPAVFFTTNWTKKWHLPSMQSHVCGQSAYETETCFTNGACERFLSCMNS